MTKQTFLGVRKPVVWSTRSTCGAVAGHLGGRVPAARRVIALPTRSSRGSKRVAIGDAAFGPHQIDQSV